MTRSRRTFTSPTGGVDHVTGADAFLARFPDLSDAELGLTVTQAAAVEPDRVLALVRIEARRGDAELHNFGGFLVRVAGGRMTDFWMVDALPAESAAFWAGEGDRLDGGRPRQPAGEIQAEPREPPVTTMGG